MGQREEERERRETVTVLVVDDEALIRWSVRQRLEARGYEVVDAADARTAIQRSRGTDLAVVDRRLPDGDGLAVSALLLLREPRRPVILMTAVRSPELEAAARELGIDGVIQKPFELDDLVEMVGSHLGVS